MKNIKRRMTPQPLKIRADVELTCFAYDGVERIRDAMRAAQVRAIGGAGGKGGERERGGGSPGAEEEGGAVDG